MTYRPESSGRILRSPRLDAPFRIVDTSRQHHRKAASLLDRDREHGPPAAGRWRARAEDRPAHAGQEGLAREHGRGAPERALVARRGDKDLLPFLSPQALPARRKYEAQLKAVVLERPEGRGLGTRSFGPSSDEAWSSPPAPGPCVRDRGPPAMPGFAASRPGHCWRPELVLRSCHGHVRSIQAARCDAGPGRGAFTPFFPMIALPTLPHPPRAGTPLLSERSTTRGRIDAAPGSGDG